MPCPRSAQHAANITFNTRLSDAQIAWEVRRRLAWDAAVPDNALKIKVTDGRIRLFGELQRDQQRVAALEDITRLFGVAGVADHTTVKAT
jgi:osmotically-inducible protein OsmY